MNPETQLKKISRFSKLPKWLRVCLLILSIITMVYWIIIFIYKALALIRVIGAFLFEKRNYWTFIGCLIVLIVGSLLIAQFALNLDPFGKIGQWFVNVWLSFKKMLVNIII